VQPLSLETIRLHCNVPSAYFSSLAKEKQASTKTGSKRTRVEGNTEGKAARKEEEQEEGMKANMTRDHWAGGVKQHKENQPNEENLTQCVS
jgi:hypothetical protein